jgi:hypothetical protein
VHFNRVREDDVKVRNHRLDCGHEATGMKEEKTDQDESADQSLTAALMSLPLAG